ncbi:hypothetical protein [Pseudoalteromonas luteoviolacea]|uniref:Uncharacterized protein n=1 Tax=Pseudoalteromonas luteoviolacea S4054 TaxID=1129367 RepID=A0A0F6ADN6_9GAMM|nr:hypothetical protein [Pseudoalteromonas luteoviolacea]AOT08499.1 hypothetical protein S4054249_11865 [Pseudoalteromonas luteoviolacea]AOT13415.1 hypothetical protein S40542_11840 [Pseudoalteromonas luteoviolacea]AOT18328.1 hypothetical protein S4054_11840 [Pseudoalteromonas luteoviolacea]KKE83504.1 hypothetical protein N479_14125 [Pseudoalteromonas luteoviolacea S4054]KZN75941.1 hypothetical protein N481_06220 [Pseudoalteromonas luteoviolacea S4047-1]
MANYQEAFDYAFSEKGEKYRCLHRSDELICGQSLRSQGFSEVETRRLFKQVYAFELWLELKGEQILNQQAAGLLLLLNARGYLSVMLNEMQNYFNINLSSKMCECTLNRINALPEKRLNEWLVAGLDYFSLVENKQLQSMNHNIKA